MESWSIDVVLDILTRLVMAIGIGLAIIVVHEWEKR